LQGIRGRKGFAKRSPDIATWIDGASSDARKLAFLIDASGEEHIVFGSDYCGGMGLSIAFNGVSGSDLERFRRFTNKNSRANPH
jgi:hypothetical protein